MRRGSLDDLDALGAAAAAADGVIHLAFDNAQMLAGNYDGAVATDLRAVEALGEALTGSDKPFVSTSGTLDAHVRRDWTASAPRPTSWPRARASTPRTR